MRKRLLASLLSLAMLLTMLPVTAFASEEAGNTITGIALNSSTTDSPIAGLKKNSAETGSPVTFQMEQDISLGDTQYFVVTGANNQVVFDLNGHKLSCGMADDVRFFDVSAGAELTIIDSTANSGEAAEAATPTAPVVGDGLMTTAKTSTVAAISVSDEGSKLKLQNVHYTTTATGRNAGTTLLYVSDGASLVVESSDLESKGAGMCISGNNTTGNMTATVTDSKLTSNIGPAIYMPCLIGVTVTNSTLNGGVGMRMGTLTARNCVITGQEENSSGTIDDPLTLADTSCLWTGDGIYLFAGTYKSSDETNPPDCTIDLQDTDITASNGNGIGIYRISGTTGQYIKYPQNVTVNIGKGVNVTTTKDGKQAYALIGEGGNEDGKKVTLTQNITGGTFSSKLPEGSVPDTHVVVATTENEKTTYTVKEAVESPVKVSLETEGLTTASELPKASLVSPETGVESLPETATKWYKSTDETTAVESFEEGTYKAKVTVSADTDYIFKNGTTFQFESTDETTACETDAETFTLTSKEVTVEKPKYAVTIADSIEGGSVTASIPDADNNTESSIESGTSLAEGTTVKVTATPADTHTFKKITVTPDPAVPEETAQEFETNPATFNMPGYPVTISAEFEAKQQEKPVVTVAIDESAAETLTESTTETSVEDATKATVTLATPAGYTMEVTKGGTTDGITGSDTAKTVPLDEDANVITITLTKAGADTITYTVTINNTKTGGDEEKPVVRIIIDDGDPKLLDEGDNGTIDVTNGETVIVSVQDPAELADGYDVRVENANSEGSVNEQTVTLGKGENVITITLSNGSNTLTYTVTINNKVGEDPNPPVGDDGYTITKDTTVNGELTVVESANEGETVTVTVTPDPGYEVDTISVTYTEDGTVVEYEEIEGVFTFVMPAADVTIVVTFKQIPPQPSQSVKLVVKDVETNNTLLSEGELDDTKTYVINVDNAVKAVTFDTEADITKGEEGETISGEDTLAEGVNEYTLTAGEKTFKLTIVRAKATQDPDTSVNASDVKTEESTTEDGKLTITAEVPVAETLTQIANTSEGGTVKIPAEESNPSGDVASSTVSLPQTVTESMKDKDVNVEIATNVGTVTIPSEAVVQALTDEDANVTSAELKLVVENAANPDATAKATFEVSIKKIIKDENGDTVDEKDTNIEQLSKPIILAFAFDNDGIELHQPTLAHVVRTGSKIAYRSIKNSFYDAAKKYIIGETDHLSEFAVVDLYQLEDFGEQKLTLRRDPNENWPGAVKVVVTNAVTIGSDPVYIVQYKDPVKAMYVYTVVRPEADGTVSFIAMNNSEVCVWEALDGAFDANDKLDLSGRTNDIKIDSSEPMGFKGEVVTTSMATVE